MNISSHTLYILLGLHLEKSLQINLHLCDPGIYLELRFMRGDQIIQKINLVTSLNLTFLWSEVICVNSFNQYLDVHLTNSYAMLKHPKQAKYKVYQQAFMEVLFYCEIIKFIVDLELLRILVTWKKMPEEVMS